MNAWIGIKLLWGHYCNLFQILSLWLKYCFDRLWYYWNKDIPYYNKVVNEWYKEEDKICTLEVKILLWLSYIRPTGFSKNCFTNTIIVDLIICSVLPFPKFVYTTRLPRLNRCHLYHLGGVYLYKCWSQN